MCLYNQVKPYEIRENDADRVLEDTVEYLKNTLNQTNSFYGAGDVFINYNIDSNLEITEIGLRNIQVYDYMQSTLDSYVYNHKTGEYEKFVIGTKAEKLNNLNDYLENNTLKIKLTINENKGETGMPVITVTGREK